MRLDRSFSLGLHISRTLNLWSVLYLCSAAEAEQQCVLQNFGRATTIFLPFIHDSASKSSPAAPVPAQLCVEFDGV
jgi:hypothetical protein